MPTETRPCKRCGMPITFIENAATGKQIPAQRIRTIYHYNERTRQLEKRESEEVLYVSHFETCPNASEFGGKKR